MDSHSAIENGWNYSCSSSWADIKDTFMASLPVFFSQDASILALFFQMPVLSFPTATLFHLASQFSWFLDHSFLSNIPPSWYIHFNLIMIVVALIDKMKTQWDYIKEKTHKLLVNLKNCMNIYIVLYTFIFDYLLSFVYYLPVKSAGSNWTAHNWHNLHRFWKSQMCSHKKKRKMLR